MQYEDEECENRLFCTDTRETQIGLRTFSCYMTKIHEQEDDQRLCFQDMY